jgi:Domain of unknown function (DUF3850)
VRHLVRSWPVYFGAIMTGEKRFEVRKNDRDYQTGDTILLKEYDPEKNIYTGRELLFRIGYIMPGPCCGVADGYVVFMLEAAS